MIHIDWLECASFFSHTPNYDFRCQMDGNLCDRFTGVQKTSDSLPTLNLRLRSFTVTQI